MTKEEMKNRISMALKDPILQQGFEIICKENAELKKEVEKHKWNDIFLEESAFYDKKIAEEYTTLQERIAELEKENAELKEKLNFSTQYYQGEKAKEQLTKAKEIIENIIRVTWGEGWNYSLDWKVKAEQFLNNEVEK